MGRFIPNENTWIGFALTVPGALAAPAIPTAAGTGTGGHLPAGAMYYRITGLDVAGETLPCAETTLVTTTGTTSIVTLTITPLVGATGYRIYGRSLGAELLLAEVGLVTTYVDDGTITPRGPLPVKATAGNLASPKVADINNAVDLTHYVTAINASATGSAVPTPAFDTKFETSIDGTSQGTFTADFYRDDAIDLAWNTLPRGTKGYMIISRYGGIPNTIGDVDEVWPVTVLSRSVPNETNNAPVTFTLTCSVPEVPAEDAATVA